MAAGEWYPEGYFPKRGSEVAVKEVAPELDGEGPSGFTPPVAEHVHEWTVFPSGKRKCKPCGAVERPERNE